MLINTSAKVIINMGKVYGVKGKRGYEDDDDDWKVRFRSMNN